jgi:hypothetical protein
MKSRDVSTLDYLEVLQEEFICAVIRSKIYPRLSDKRHYEKVTEGKREKIVDIAKRNSLITIFDDKDEYLEYWLKTVKSFGFPNFTYNQEYNNSKSHFPYKGTIVEILDESSSFKYAVSHHVDFENQQVSVIEKEGGTEIHKFHHKKIRRLTLEETDKMFYYYQGNEFKVKGKDSRPSVGILTSFDFDTNLAWIRIKGESAAYPHRMEDVARIL